MHPNRWVIAAVALLALPQPALAGEGTPSPGFEPRSLDGSANNLAHPTWGQSDVPYRRIAPARYADAIGVPAGGPPARFVSNRVFNDTGQNLFSEGAVSQWVWTWGQFMDHTFGLAAPSDERSPIAFDPSDPLEAFGNDLGVIEFARNRAAPGSGTSASNPREQINTIDSYIDGSSVYGNTAQRLGWLRDGPRLLLDPNGLLPRADARGDVQSAPEMQLDGPLTGRPQNAVVAGDVRANENMALTAVHTLFAREHNRIVDALPASLPAEQRFEIARRVVGAEQQFITYEEFLPAIGVRLAPYRGYQSSVNATLGNEFATTAYRMHSMIHGEFEIDVPAAEFPPARLDPLRAMGVAVAAGPQPGTLALAVPLNTAFFNPDLLPAIGLGPILAGLSGESQYRNDEQIDNALRSVLFQLPGPGAADPTACVENPETAGCFQGVADLGAVDIERGRDHGIPRYNDLRRALGLSEARSFTEITGESTEDATGSTEVPGSLDFLELADIDGLPVAMDTPERQTTAVSGERRTSLASRLKAIYGSVDRVDAFVGMLSEPHARGSELGPLQLALWRRQFGALRDGDRFFYADDPALRMIDRRYGISYRRSLGDLIARNTATDRAKLPANVFLAAG